VERMAFIERSALQGALQTVLTRGLPNAPHKGGCGRWGRRHTVIDSISAELVFQFNFNAVTTESWTVFFIGVRGMDGWMKLCLTTLGCRVGA
jgi:hypothetical protein